MKDVRGNDNALPTAQVGKTYPAYTARRVFSRLVARMGKSVGREQTHGERLIAFGMPLTSSAVAPARDVCRPTTIGDVFASPRPRGVLTGETAKVRA